MNWKDIKVSADNTHFVYDGMPVFGRRFTEVLKFHEPGLAPVKDESGSYHINANGNELYSERFSRTFGYYFNRSSVVSGNKWFHLNEGGKRAYSESFLWTGNYQEDRCAVRDENDRYFHIDLNGKRPYTESFIYCGDFKDGYACAKIDSGIYRHIDLNGNYLNDRTYLDLGVFHKNFATAKDNDGWFHIDRKGDEIYKQRFNTIEPFYNGYSVAVKHDNQKVIIDEGGREIIKV